MYYTNLCILCLHIYIYILIFTLGYYTGRVFCSSKMHKSPTENERILHTTFDMCRAPNPGTFSFAAKGLV